MEDVPWEMKILVKPLAEDDYEPPKYSDPGRIFVEIYYIDPLPGSHDKRYLIGDCGTDGSAFWIEEGVGVEWWLNDIGIDLELPGCYVIEGIIGHYYKGTFGFDDDNEEWEFKSVRYATEEEIEAGGLLDDTPADNRLPDVADLGDHPVAELPGGQQE